MTAEALSTNAVKSPGISPAAIWPRVRDFFVHVVAQVRVLRKVYPGVMHALIFWGMTIQIVGTIISLMQIPLFVPFALEWPRNMAYLIFELVMDLAGVAIIVGVLMAAFRRVVMRPKSLETRWDDAYAIVLLLIIPLMGFTTEGLRHLATAPPWGNWSPIGNLVARLFGTLGMSPQTAWNLHYGFYWGHIITGLIFVGSIPFTKLRHLITGPLNIVLRPLQKPSALTPIENIEEAEVLGVGEVSAFTPQQLLSFDACLNCGRCEEACPAAFSGMILSPRILIQSLRGVMVETLIKKNGNGEQHSLEEVVGEMSWLCTTCGACIEKCPVYINPVAEMIDIRRYQALMAGNAPKPVASAMRNLERQGNPWGMPPSDRMAWADGLNLRVLEPGEQTDVLLYTGCAIAFDDRNKKVGRALVELMNAMGVDFAVLGDAEACCGETARRLGYEYNFQVLAQQNIETFAEYKFNRIVTPCPHCFNTLKNEYPQFGGDYVVQHYTEFLAELGVHVDGGNGSAGRVALHDSCYLGRYNQVYAPPRSLLKGAGVPYLEMRRHGVNSFCCGGGGGQMWMETDPDQRINHRRLADALETGADIVATACPYCLIMFDDAIRSKGMGEQIQVMDIAEILRSKAEANRGG